jgi:hypothetical protein
MFVRDHLGIVSRWPREQLREGAETPDTGARLQQLIAAADALQKNLEPAPKFSGNVIVLKDYRRAMRKRSA